MQSPSLYLNGRSVVAVLGVSNGKKSRLNRKSQHNKEFSIVKLTYLNLSD